MATFTQNSIPNESHDTHSQSSIKGCRGCIRQNHLTEAYRTCREMRFKVKEHKDDVFQMLQVMKRNNYLTDVKLIVGKEELLAHKLVLAAASPYFKAMFTTGLKECEMNNIRLQGVCPLVMGHLVCFMYTGEILVNEQMVCQLLSAATMFQMSQVIDVCCTFLEQQLDASNVIGIANFANHHGCMDLYNRSNAFIEQHFSEVCQDEEFLQLSACQLVDLISRDGLNVPDEKDVYCAVLKWVMHDEECRQPKMSCILQAVRCHYLSPKFLNDQMKNCKILRKVPACREYLAKIFKDLSLHKPPLEKERVPNAPCVVYIAGGYSNRQSLDTLECYDVEERQWMQLCKLPAARSGLGAVYLRGIFYAVGGRRILPSGNYHDCNWIESFDPALNQWRQRAPMHYPRNRLGITVLDEHLYAVGGANGIIYHNSVEKYDPDEDKWTLESPMAEERMGVGLAVVNRLLYAIGGFNGRERLNTVECFYPELNRWVYTTPMMVPRSGAGICSVGNCIFVIGGYDGSHQLVSVERFDTSTHTWSYAPPLKVPRSAMTVTVCNNKIFVMGGYDGNTFLSSFEVFDVMESTWSERDPLPWGRSGHAAAASFHPCLLHTDSK